MDKLYFDDLTKITCPPGMLDDDTFQRLKAWPHGVEWWNGEGWTPTSGRAERRFYPVYRARPAPLTQDVVPWHLLDDRLKVAARSKTGSAWAAESASVVDGWPLIGGLNVRIDLLKGYQRGTVDWTDSLQRRPESV